MLSTQEAMNALLSGRRVQSLDWAGGEWIKYEPAVGIVDEQGQEVNGGTFLVNTEWQEVRVHIDAQGREEIR